MRLVALAENFVTQKDCWHDYEEFKDGWETSDGGEKRNLFEILWGCE